ncbi:MAG: hypothetical protein II268_00655 [Peptococcaceae bacterium]|nr:hypothetical protein [Peptococcaceae bacterium]
MDLEYAIKLLHPDTTGEAIAEIEYYNGFSGKKAAICAIEEALELACEAMEKQIPKEPFYYKDIPHCRKCKYDINAGADYCRKCGQAILWESE